jgi:hypothetical protein
MFFENLAPPLHFLEALAGCDYAAIVSSKIDKRLFALKYGRRSESGRPWPISSEIGAVAASRQCDFESARGIIVGLRPKKCEAF